MNVQYNVYDLIREEREYQHEKFGTEADDTMNTPNDFIALISQFATKKLPNGFLPYNPETVDGFRNSMVKVAALAVAAVESVDRQRSEAGHAFYEAGNRQPSLVAV